MKRILLSIILPFLFIATSNAQTLVGLWHFNGNANDASGNGLNGTVTNATLTAGQSGAPNTAYQFNGTSSHIDVPYSALLNLSKWTVQTMVRIDGFNSNTCQEEHILTRGTFQNSDYITIAFNDNTYDHSCTIASANYNEFVAGAAGYPSGSFTGSHFYIQAHTWYCHTVTYDGHYERFYINGALIDSTAWTNQYNFSNSQPPLIFGYYPGGGSGYPYWLNGAIDELAIWDDALSTAQVASTNCNFVSTDSLYINQPFHDTAICANGNGDLFYTVTNPNFFHPGNVFTLQLSDANGSFANPVNVGSVTSTTSGNIAYSFPPSTSFGRGYRIRIISSSPQVISQDDQIDITYYPGYITFSLGASNNPNISYPQNTLFNRDTVCGGSTITYSANINNAGIYSTYLWRKNGLYVDSNSTYTDSNITNFEVVDCAIRTTNNCYGWNGLVRIQMTVIPQSFSGVATTSSINSPICAQTPVTFTATVTNGGTSPSYQWMKNGSVVAGATASVYTDNDLQPADVITCTSIGNQVCAAPSTSQPIALTIYPRPDTTVVASGPIHVCSTDSVTLHAPNGSTYQWQLNGGNIPGATTPDYTVHSTGSYTVYVVNNFGCYTTSTTIAATVSPAPNAAISNISGYLKICSNDSVVLAPTFGSSANYTYQWMRNGTNIYGATGAQYAATTAGNYSEVVSNNGCLRTSNVLTTTTVAAPTDSQLKYGQTVLCPGVPGVQLSADTTVGQPQHYLWLMNNAPITGATAATYFATIPTTYTLKITDTVTGCSIVTRPVNVVRTAGPAPIITYHYPKLTTGIFNSYQWYLNGSMVPTGTSTAWQPTQSGAYAVGVTDSNGCTGTSANFYFTYSGVQSVTKEDVRIYPNPANDVVYIEAPVAVNAMVYSIDGRLIFNENAVKMIDISQWTNGVYLIKILDGSSIVKIDKLIKN